MAAVASVARDEGRDAPLPIAATKDDAIVEQAARLRRRYVPGPALLRSNLDPIPAIILDILKDCPCGQSSPDRRVRLWAGPDDGAGKRNPGREAIMVVTRDEHRRHGPVFLASAVDRLGASKPKRLVQLFPEASTIIGRPGPSLGKGLPPESASETDPDVIRHQIREGLAIASRNRLLKLATKPAESGIATTEFYRRQELRRGSSERERSREH